jgi:hypothetical protein
VITELRCDRTIKSPHKGSQIAFIFARPYQLQELTGNKRATLGGTTMCKVGEALATIG